MKRKKLYKIPFDAGHDIMYNEYSETYLKSIGVPGKFVKKINRRVRLKTGPTGEMDSAFILDPDYKVLFERVAATLEHLTKLLDNPKLHKLGHYDIQLVVDEQLPTLILIASHLTNKQYKELKRSPSDITKPYFLDLSEENIRKRLSTVRKIINNNEYLNTENALNLGIIALYAPRKYACEITEEVIILFCKIHDKLELKMEYTLYSVLTFMIDAYFNEEEDYRRLSDMLNNTTTPESKEKFESLESVRQSLEYAQEDLQFAKEDLKSTKKDLKCAKKDIKEKDNLINNLQLKILSLEEQINAK